MKTMLTILCLLSLISKSTHLVKSELAEQIKEKNVPSTEEPIGFDSYKSLTDLEDYPNVCDDYYDGNCAQAWLHEINKVKIRNKNRLLNVNYRYSTNINKENLKLKIKFQHQNLRIEKKMKSKFRKFQWKNFSSRQLKRIFKLMTPTIQSKNENVGKMIIKYSNEMKSIYNHARPCYKQCLPAGETGIVDLFMRERNYDTLLGYWSSWRNVTGRRLRDLFIKKVNLENRGAKENGYADAASFRLKDDFEEDNFNATMIGLYDEILPLYKQLHGYVRFCLAKFYPDRFDKNGPIPAHIFGNNWAQEWDNIMPILQQCRNATSSYNIQKEADKRMKSRSVTDMFRMAEDFYVSIGLFKMTPNFWARSVIEQRPGKVMDCHASAFDFLNGHDFRIRMCTERNLNEFTTIHHEMGHIEYFMAYRKQPYIFRDAANAAFHEAIGDTVVMSAKTPEHLKRIGLIPSFPTSKEFDFDLLMMTALERLAFIPFAMTMNAYIWSVYNGSVPQSRLNAHWWDLRQKYQGIMPPILRTENYFDPGAKFHISFGHSYSQFFIGCILQFQFYEAMCNASGNSGPLHRCDFYHSKAAGALLLEMLETGQSLHWRDCLEMVTGSKEITSQPIMRFFDPLYKWLKETNDKLKIPIGW